jgi:hypothetical protein
MNDIAAEFIKLARRLPPAQAAVRRDGTAP